MSKEKKAIRKQHYIDEIQQMIRDKYPEAEFDVKEVRRTPETWIEVYVRDEADWDVIEMMSDKTTDILVEAGMMISVLPMSYGKRPSVRSGKTGKEQQSA